MNVVVEAELLEAGFLARAVVRTVGVVRRINVPSMPQRWDTVAASLLRCAAPLLHWGM